MGSYAHLRIGSMEFDWSKNMLNYDHSKLFLPTDRKVATYFYADNINEEKEAFVRKLSECKGRLELMGYTLNNCKKEFNWLKQKYYSSDYYKKIHDISFEQYAKAMSLVDAEKLNPNLEEYGDFDFGEFVSTIAFQLDEFNKIIPLREISKYDGGEFFTNLSPYLNLRLLLENPKNLDLELIWSFFDILEGGYVDDSEIYSGLDDDEKFLVVTEGSSDSFVIKKCFDLIRPDIADFFYFVDMKENYPFTGTGNLFNFSKGLKSIGVINKVIIVYDNDSEGIQKYNDTLKLSLPENMSVIKLPNLDELTTFPTIGPSGLSVANINEKAASIEAYMDFFYGVNFDPIVRWKNFVEKQNTYHGALERKEEYIRAFKSVKKDSNYNFKKLNTVLDCIYSAATAILDAHEK